MLDKFLLYINDKKLLHTGDKVLLAVSGGRDSMVMLHLFLQSGWSIGVAHINHKLRGKDADSDAHFVSDICTKHHIPFYLLTVPKGSFIGGNTQAKARKIRYAWLNETARANGFTKIATAHHATDAVETTIMHMLRGTGIAGMDGISAFNGITIRPMLFLTADEIDSFAKANHIPFRDDASNATDKYLRNRIRHHLIPILLQLSPDAVEQMYTTSRHLAEAKTALDFLHSHFFAQAAEKKNGIIAVEMEKFRQHESGPFLLWYAVKEYGFRREQTDDMLGTSHSPGVEWYSATHRACMTRQTMEIIERPSSEGYTEVTWSGTPAIFQFGNTKISLNWVERDEVTFDGNADLYLDGDTFSLPLRLRKWRPGDTFSPLGMKGKNQKVQDFLTNKKVSRIQKEQVWVLEANEAIVCLPGYRIAESVKLTENTTKILRVSCLP